MNSLGFPSQGRWWAEMWWAFLRMTNIQSSHSDCFWHHTPLRNAYRGTLLFSLKSSDELERTDAQSFWRNQLCFPKMIRLLSAAPWPIRLRKDLISQAKGTIWHPRPELWSLWPLNGSLVTLRQFYPSYRSCWVQGSPLPYLRYTWRPSRQTAFSRPVSWKEMT